ncbi:MAG: ATP-binding cassette domain-containing protein [Peptoniphilaceae bacterium]
MQKQSFRDLSGGQKQRVLLARALCATKQLLVLDEPTAGLDPLVTRELYELITTINQDLGLTILMVSHDLQSVVHSAENRSGHPGSFRRTHGNPCRPTLRPVS